jgi:hypothetical protein
MLVEKSQILRGFKPESAKEEEPSALEQWKPAVHRMKPTNPLAEENVNRFRDSLQKHYSILKA